MVWCAFTNCQVRDLHQAKGKISPTNYYSDHPIPSRTRLVDQGLHTTLHQRGYPTTLINKGLELAENTPLRQLRNPQKHNNEKPLTYVSTYSKINPEVFTEILKNLEEIQNKDKIKEIQDTTKIIKSQRQPKNRKIILTSSTFEKNTTQGVTNAKINDAKYVI